jgi:hypothetical protein
MRDACQGADKLMVRVHGCRVRVWSQQRVGSNAWLRLSSGEDDFKDPLLGGELGEVTTIKRTNSHTQATATSRCRAALAASRASHEIADLMM